MEQIKPPKLLDIKASNHPNNGDSGAIIAERTKVGILFYLTGRKGSEIM